MAETWEIRMMRQTLIWMGAVQARNWKVSVRFKGMNIVFGTTMLI